MNLPYRTFYMLAPAGFTTGGIELAHQLTDRLRRQGADARVVYVQEDRYVPGTPVPDAYRNYDIAVADSVEDSADNFLLLPEIYLYWAKRFRHIRTGCWWMSVDNYFKRSCFRERMLHETPSERWRLLKWRLKGGRFPDISLRWMRRQGTRLLHFCQSEYARRFLESHGILHARMLGDYINTELAESGAPAAKEDLILYNPAKGLAYTEKLMACMPDVPFIALKGMSRQELGATLDRAKLYIDFGPFPGKDRLPREAALHHCILVTGRFGAAAFQEDLPIPGYCKYDLDKTDFRLLAGDIRRLMADYAAQDAALDGYRSHIRTEKAEFENQADRYFIHGEL